jgi:hypothetical protein
MADARLVLRDGRVVENTMQVDRAEETVPEAARR